MLAIPQNAVLMESVLKMLLIAKTVCFALLILAIQYSVANVLQEIVTILIQPIFVSQKESVMKPLMLVKQVNSKLVLLTTVPLLVLVTQ